MHAWVVAVMLQASWLACQKSRRPLMTAQSPCACVKLRVGARLSPGWRRAWRRHPGGGCVPGGPQLPQQGLSTGNNQMLCTRERERVAEREIEREWQRERLLCESLSPKAGRGGWGDRRGSTARNLCHAAPQPHATSFSQRSCSPTASWCTHRFSAPCREVVRI
jgi:hypothetical protein